MIHTLHGDVYESGLNADCPRCQQHAARPWDSLDVRMLARLRAGVFFGELDKLAAERLVEWDGRPR